MPFAFCTRERLPWTEFAESATTGPTTKFLSMVLSFLFFSLFPNYDVCGYLFVAGQNQSGSDNLTDFGA
jgi:hypothetical protein